LDISTSTQSQLSAHLYSEPAPEIVALVDAPRPPLHIVSPDGQGILLLEIEAYPPLKHVAEPVLRLAGIRLSPVRGSRQQLQYGQKLHWVSCGHGESISFALPESPRIGLPVFAPDGSAFAFTNETPESTELWLGNPATGELRRVPELRVNNVLFEQSFVFSGQGRHLWVATIPYERGDPPRIQDVPLSPSMQESMSRPAPVATYQDLLKDPHDEELFKHYATSQWACVDLLSASWRVIGEPGLFEDLQPSPDGQYLLCNRLVPPFSYRVGSWGFPRVVEVLSAMGEQLSQVAHVPLADDTPRFGVRQGYRNVMWQAARAATLCGVQALDGGDPRRRADFRDGLWTLEAPFTGTPQEARRFRHRLTSLLWTATAGQAIVTELDRERRWRTTSLVFLDEPGRPAQVLFDRSDRDAYIHPGEFLLKANTHQLLQEGDMAWLSGDGATPQGLRPFLDKVNLKTGAKQRVFLSADDALERVMAVLPKVSNAPLQSCTLLVQHQTPRAPPSLWLLDPDSGHRRQLLPAEDGVVRMDGVTREILHYQRHDQVPLTGTLYLPKDRQPGERLPLLIWAYPVDYSDAKTAGQVRGSDLVHVRPLGASPIYFATQGWAVLMDAAMPVVGDTFSMNDTFVAQVVSSATAAIDALDARELIDRRRVVAGGHSYGAFMVATLMAHSNLLAAGIARNGAYNRTLTPFGFQQERRTYWEAPDTYHQVSPFSHAHRIKAPLLLIHGATDGNAGTHPMQSERMYAAVAGNGGTARLVMLPCEGHAYRARESILHVLAEMLSWARRWTQQAP
jgi:dipeptidyl aminopeptidase/acylaminoacyl peptidase